MIAKRPGKMKVYSCKVQVVHHHAKVEHDKLKMDSTNPNKTKIKQMSK